MLHASSPQCRRAGTTRSPAFSSGGARDELAGVVLRLAADAALLVAELAAEEVRRVEPLRQLVAAVLLRERVAVHAAVLRAEGDQRVAFRPVGGVGREDGGDLSRTGDMRSDAASQDRDGWHTHRLHRRGCACAVLCLCHLPKVAVVRRERQRLRCDFAAQQCPRECGFVTERRTSTRDVVSIVEDLISAADCGKRWAANHAAVLTWAIRPQSSLACC